MLDYFSRSQTRISKALDRDSVPEARVRTVILEVVKVVVRVAGQDMAKRVGERLLEADAEFIDEDAQ